MAETSTGKSDWSILLGDRRVRKGDLHNIGELGIVFFTKVLRLGHVRASQVGAFYEGIEYM